MPPATSPEIDSDVPEFLRGLNIQQRAAVLHGESPLLIIAGAGTGKTTTLANRVAWQIVSGIDPGQIVLLTFTRRAAAEMMRRVEAILMGLDAAELGDPGITQRSRIRRIRGGTFHSVATTLLRRHGQIIGLYPDFTILDRGDAEDLLNVVRSKLNLPKSGNRFPLKGTCMDIYSRCVNTQKPLEVILKKYFPWVMEHQDKLGELFNLYVNIKEQQRVLDFDDLLLFWNALAEHPDGSVILQQQFQRILVDEYQDTNTLQAQILKNMCPEGKGLTAVGDDAQSIYSFRAATVRNILDLPKEFPGTEVIPLEQNYRSTQSILDVTNKVIAEATERHHKNLWSDRGPGAKPVLVTCSDEDTQNEYAIDRILERREHGVPLKQQAVLFRASHHSMALEAELGRRNIPFQKYGGLRFLETAHVKDLMSFLRLIENPMDGVAGFRVLMLLPGIGNSKAESLMESLREAGGHFEAWLSWTPPKATRESWPQFVRMLKTLEQRGRDDEGGVASDINAIRMFYTPLLESRYDNVKARSNDLEQLEVMATRYQTRNEFLSEMALDPPTSTQELPADPWLDEDYLILSTIHSAKGLEWDSVFVIHAADGNIPSDMATGSEEEIEEERRLFYVAMTRAKNNLYVMRPERYYFHHRRRSDQHSLSKITRFLPPDIQATMERVSHGDVFGNPWERHPGSGNRIQGDTSEIRRKISKLWG
ncbi:MAG: ATP-dependent helicase [Planctomycetaceae bacterium]|nr:ATP-dependent helicase [Planctomycetaceae bacterium]